MILSTSFFTTNKVKVALTVSKTNPQTFANELAWFNKKKENWIM